MFVSTSLTHIYFEPIQSPSSQHFSLLVSDKEAGESHKDYHKINLASLNFILFITSVLSSPVITPKFYKTALVIAAKAPSNIPVRSQMEATDNNLTRI